MATGAWAAASPEFIELAGVAGGAVQAHQRRATLLLNVDQLRDAAAREWMRLAICGSSKGVCSAVAWTSTNCPAPVITTFISTSAWESSS